MNSKLYLLLGLAFAVLLLFSSMAVSARELPSKTSLDAKAKTKGAEVKDKNAVNDAEYNQGYGGYPGDGSGGYPGGGRNERPREYGGRRDDQERPPEYGGPGVRPPGYGGPGGGQERPPGYGGPGGGQERPPGYGGGGGGCYYGYCGYRCCNAAEAQAQAQPQN